MLFPLPEYTDTCMHAHRQCFTFFFVYFLALELKVSITLYFSISTECPTTFVIETSGRSECSVFQMELCDLQSFKTRLETL